MGYTVTWSLSFVKILNYPLTPLTSKDGRLGEIQFSSVAQLCPTLYDPMYCSMPGFAIHHQHLELAQTHVHWVRDAIQPFLILCHPSSPAFNLSPHQGLFKWISSLPGGQSIGASASHQSSTEYSGLISFRMDWLNLLAVQGILKSLLQHHSSKASILWCSVFFTVQLSHP